MLEIKKISDKMFSLLENGEEARNILEPFAAESIGDWIVIRSQIRPTIVYRVKYGDIIIDGATYDSPADAVNALSFIGNFKRGGGSAPSPTPIYQSKSVVIEENGAITVKPDMGYDCLKAVKIETNVSEGSNALFIKSDVWTEVVLPTELQTGTLYVKAFNGLLFIGSSASMSGIWKLNTTTEVFTQIHPTGYNWQFWREFDGDLFVSSSTSSITGILKLNSNKEGFTQVHSVGYGWRYWYEFNGELFVSSGGGTALGILKLNAARTTFTQIHPTGYNWQFWQEFDGDLFVSSSTSSITGILKLNSNKEGFTQIYTIYSGWQHWREFDGNLFVSSDVALSGILMLNANKNGFTQVYGSLGANWQFWREFDGDLFVSSSNSGALGILKLNAARTTFTQIHPTGYNWQFWQEFDGDLFVNGSIASSTGILKLNSNKEGFTQVHSVGYGWRYWYEFNGELFVSASVGTALGILKLNAAKTAFMSVYRFGIDFNVVIDNTLISSVISNENIATLDLITSSVTSPIAISGTAIGRWILTPSKFIKFNKEYPIETYLPFGYRNSISPIGDDLGNVFIVSQESVIFNKKPLYE